MAFIHLDWAVDREGYHLVSGRDLYPKGKGRRALLLEKWEREGTFIVRKGGPLDETTPLKAVGLYRRLAERDATAEGALDFVSAFGFLHRRNAKQEPVSAFVEARNDIRRLLQVADQKDWPTIANWLRTAEQKNIGFVSGGVGRLGLVFDWREGMDRPSFRFRPGSLLSAIYIQALMDFCAGTELRKCKRPGCDEWFTFGPGTGHRETRQYCTDKCRSAHRHLIRKGSSS